MQMIALYQVFGLSLLQPCIDQADGVSGSLLEQSNREAVDQS